MVEMTKEILATLPHCGKRYAPQKILVEWEEVFSLLKEAMADPSNDDGQWSAGKRVLPPLGLKMTGGGNIVLIEDEDWEIVHAGTVAKNTPEEWAKQDAETAIRNNAVSAHNNEIWARGSPRKDVTSPRQIGYHHGPGCRCPDCDPA